MTKRLYTLYVGTQRIKQWFNSRFTSIGKLFLLIISIAFLFGVNLQRSMIYQILSLTSVLLFLSFIFSFRFRTNLKISRRLPETCIAGRELRYSIQIENQGKRVEQSIFYREQSATSLPSLQEYNGFTEDRVDKRNIFDRKMGYYKWLSLLLNNNRFECADKELPLLKAGKTVEVEITLLPLKRGTIHLDGSVLTRIDPFGLCKRQVLRRNPEKILVLPKLYPVPEVYFPGSRKYHQGGIIAAQNVGDSTEFVSLRDYTHGDPIKHIDWKSTARTGNTIVKQYRDEYFSRYGLILDSYITKSHSQAFEEAVSVAASIMMDQNNNDAVLDLFFVGRQCITCSIGRGLADQQRMLEILASITTCQDQQFKDMTNLVKSHSSLLSGVVVILIDLDEERKSLINYLITNKIPYKLIVMVENHGEYAAKKEKLHIDVPMGEIDINQVEQGLSLL